ncbi:MAG TPA: dihydrolipoamide acetyltransferase family protein [Propionibacteriaceae bacterium]|nr:dihydrolipoamide acetyltransferase family protein [Propionibacteriaceae bacterium]
MKQFRLPDPGEGLVEAEIVTWRVAVGDQVEVNDIVVEIETSKSLVELPVPYAGTVTALLAAEGDVVEVGAPIISIDDGPPEPALSPDQQDLAAAQLGEGAGEVDAVVEDGVVGGAAPGGRVAVLVGYGPRTTEAKRRPRKADRPEPPDVEAHDQVADTFSTSGPVSFRADERTPLTPHQSEPVGPPLPGPGSAPVTAVRSAPATGRGVVLAKPPVRKLAKDRGVDLQALVGSGPGGVITRADVEAAAEVGVEAAESPAAESPAAESPSAEQRLEPATTDTRIPVRGVRKATADAMVASAFSAPHVTEWLACDVTASMELLERLRSRREFAGMRLSPLLLVAKAVCLALRQTPILNSSFDAEAEEIVVHGSVNLGIAAATPRGLLVPNIKGAGDLSLLELATAVNELVSVAKEGKTQPAATSGGTFTLTNVGVFGVDAGTPILNPGEVGIVCLGAIDRRPWVVGTGVDERIEPRWVTTLALSFDHRVVDGEQGSRFLAAVADILSDPAVGLLF